MLATIKTLTSAFLGAVSLLPVIILFVIGEPGEVPDTIWFVILGAVAAGAVGSIEAIGFRAVVVPPSDAADHSAASAAAFQASTILRLALCESVAIVGLALAFVADSGGFLLCLLGSVVALLLMARYAWPGESNISRFERSLERGGGSSDLREGLGLAPGQVG